MPKTPMPTYIGVRGENEEAILMRVQYSLWDSWTGCKSKSVVSMHVRVRSVLGTPEEGGP